MGMLSVHCRRIAIRQAAGLVYTAIVVYVGNVAIRAII
jgi:hypothetical protein